MSNGKLASRSFWLCAQAEVYLQALIWHYFESWDPALIIAAISAPLTIWFGSKFLQGRETRLVNGSGGES